MRPSHRIALALWGASLLISQAVAQTPPTPSQPGARAPRRRSVVQHYPYPYPGAYVGDQSAGYRNPGHLGRYKEYYPAGDQFQAPSQVDAVRPATFGRGSGAPSYAEQRAAQQVGIQRSSAMQRHIDNYARPYFGYGYGVGYFGGFY